MDNIEILKETVRKNNENVKYLNESVLKPAEKSLATAKQQLAEALCFCKVGDKISNNIETLIVSKVSYGYGDFEIRGFKIKKNGDPFKYDNKIYDWNGWDKWRVVE